MLTHERDLEYFGEYPAPIMQAVQELHHTNINSTISFFGPMLYFLLRDIGAEQVLEIGHAEGYTAHYLANAVKDNGTRFGMKDNKYYGIDIVQTEKVRSALEAKGLPVDVRNVDSMTLSPETFPGLLFDVIFQDGCHDTDHVLHEFKTMWPQLKGEGKGYWIAHDVFGPSEDGMKKIKHLLDDGIYKGEYIRIFSCYGLMIIRKMDGWDESKLHWRD
jgi:hypothetical protein